MNNDEIKIETADKKEILNVPEIKAEKAEIKPAAKVISKSERLAERLRSLCEKREKAYSAQSAAEKKTLDIDEKIEAVKEEIRNEELRVLDGLCAANSLKIKEIAAFISAITEKMTLNEAAELLEIKFENGGKNIER